MSFHPLTGKRISQGLPHMGVAAGEDQPDDGGVRVMAWSNGNVRIEIESGHVYELAPFLACDVGQRLLQMGLYQLQQEMTSLMQRAGELTVVRNPPVKLDIVQFPDKG